MASRRGWNWRWKGKVINKELNAIFEKVSINSPLQTLHLFEIFHQIVLVTKKNW